MPLAPDRLRAIIQQSNVLEPVWQMESQADFLVLTRPQTEMEPNVI